MNQLSLTLVEQHLRSNGYDLNKDSKFTIIERFQRDINIKLIIGGEKMHKVSKQMRHLDLI